MDPRSLHNLIEDAVRYSLVHDQQPRPRVNIRSGSTSNERRNGVYFPAQVHVFQMHHDDGTRADDLEGYESDGSCWTFRLPPGAKRHSASGTNCRNSKPTPAREIAMRYRAGMPLSHVLSADSTTPSSSKRRQRSSTTAQGQPTVPDFAPTEIKELTPYCRQSRADGLFEASNEAHQYMVHQKISPQDPIACGRSGCRDILRNLDALVHHIHIHNIDERSVTCGRCRKRYDDELELAKHVCRRRSRIQSFSATGIGSPIKETLARVIGKVPFRV